ncbi:hypothetical protein, partial [Pseudomonas sp. P5_A2_2]
IGVVVHPGDGCIHCVFSHSLFLCGVGLGAAMLLDIIQLDFFFVQPRLSNEMALYQQIFILLAQLADYRSDSLWACC